MTTYKVHLQDEAPRIGAGCRLVTADIGYKWVTLRTKTSAQKIRRSTWDRLKVEELGSNGTN